MFEVVDEKVCHDNGCKPLKLKWVDQDWSVGRSKGPRTEMKNLVQKTYSSPMPPSARLKMLVSTMMTGHDDGTHADGCLRWQRVMCRERTSTVKLAGGIYTYLPEGHEQEGKLARLCRSMYGTRDAASIWGDTWSRVLKDGSMKFFFVCCFLSLFVFFVSPFFCFIFLVFSLFSHFSLFSLFSFLSSFVTYFSLIFLLLLSLLSLFALFALFSLFSLFSFLSFPLFFFLLFFSF